MKEELAMGKRTVRRLIACSLIVLIVSLGITGCSSGGEEQEAVPQRFVYDYEARKMKAATRKPMAVVQREIPFGTMFPVRLLNRLSSASVRVGDVFGVEVLQDVIVDGAVVIAIGSIGQGRVTEVEPAKGWGKGGRLRISLDFVSAVDGQRIAIEANEQTAGRDKDVIGAGTLAGVVLIGPLWLFAPALSKGENIVLPADTQFYVMVRFPAIVNAHIY